ncbi:MAG: hypothetical protein R3C59_10115 [Planctomycetaceae bacterium]
MTIRLPFLIPLILVPICHAKADIIFSDNFTNDPAANGWTESIAGGGSIEPFTLGSHQTARVIVPTGTTQSISRQFNASGFENISLIADIIQDAGGIYFNTTFSAFVDYHDGNGPQLLIADTGRLGPAGELSGGAGTPETVGPLALSSLANGSMFDIILAFEEISGGSGDHTYYIDNFSLSGDALSSAAVPEPSTVALLTCALMGIIVIRPRWLRSELLNRASVAVSE